jgi:Zn-dependent protease with chaperone function
VNAIAEVPDERPADPTSDASGREAHAAIGRGAGTTQRFVLLIVVFLTGSAHMLGTLFSSYTDPQSLGSGCQLAAGVDPNVDSTANYKAMGTDAYAKCLAEYAGGWAYLWLPYLVTAFLLTLAVLHYVLLPHWKARSGRALPLADADPDGSLHDALAELAQRSGLRSMPEFVVNLSARRANALVFGRPGWYTVRLDMPLLAVFTTDRPAFDAVLLHEFAHIRNRDVDIAYLTVAVWRVFLLGVLAPFALAEGWKTVRGALSRTHSLYWQGEAPGLVRDLVLSAFIVALMYLATADILRTREIYADIDAVSRRADRTYWTRHAPSAPSDRGAARAVRAVRSALRTHPDWQTRSTALADPTALFTVRAPSMFLTGAAAGILGYFLAYTPATGRHLAQFSWLQDSDVWPTAALATAVAGVAVWRSVVHSVRRGLRAPSGLRAGFWLGVGQFTGELLVSQSMRAEWFLPFPEALLLLLLVVVPMGVLWWTAGCAALWADLSPGRGRPAAAALTLATTGLALAWWYTWWREAGTIYAAGNIYGAASSYADSYSGFTHSTTMDAIATLTSPVVAMSLDAWSLGLTAALWLIPMAGLVRRATRRRPVGVPLRARLRRLPPQTMWGTLGGAAAAIGVVVITSRAHVWVQQGEQSPVQSMVIYASWVFAILLCGTVAAAAAASFATHGQAASAMAAGGSAMAIGLTALLVVNQTDGCIPPLATLNSGCTVAGGADRVVLGYIVEYLLGGAGVLCLLGALAAAVIARLWSPAPEPDACAAGTGSGPAPKALRCAARYAPTTTTCAVLVAMCTLGYAHHLGNGSSPTVSDVPAADAIAGRTSARLLTEQVRAWNHFGGKKLLGQYSANLDTILKASSGNGINRALLRRGCLMISATARQAQAYFPLPDAQQADWSAALTETVRGARECVNGLDQNDDAVLLTAFQDLDDASGVIDQVTGKLVEEAAE